MTLISFAFGAGLLATVNPCGFAMLPAFLAYFLGDGAGDQAPRGVLAPLGQGFRVGLAVSAGFGGVFVAIGLLVAAGLRSLLPYVPWVAVAIGGALILVGSAMVAGRHVGLAVGNRVRVAQGRDYRSIVTFGAAYALVSLSCTLAVLLAVVAQALATNNPFQMLVVFVAYAAGAATLLISLTISAALAKGALLRGVRRLLPFVERVAGAVLVVSGLYLVAYWLPALGSGAGRGSPAAGPADELSARLTVFLESNQGLFAVLGAAFALVGLAAVGLRLRRRNVRHPGAGAADACCADPNAHEAVSSGHVVAE